MDIFYVTQRDFFEFFFVTKYVVKSFFMIQDHRCLLFFMTRGLFMFFLNYSRRKIGDSFAKVTVFLKEFRHLFWFEEARQFGKNVLIKLYCSRCSNILVLRKITFVINRFKQWVGFCNFISYGPALAYLE